MYDYIQFSSGGGGGEGILRGILCRKEGRGGAVGFNIILPQRGEAILHPTSGEGVLSFFFERSACMIIFNSAVVVVVVGKAF